MGRYGRVFIRYVYSGYTEQLTERVLELNVHTTYRVALTLGIESTSLTSVSSQELRRRKRTFNRLIKESVIMCRRCLFQ